MSRPLPSLELLRVFEACGRSQGFNAAAAGARPQRSALFVATDFAFAAYWRSAWSSRTTR